MSEPHHEKRGRSGLMNAGDSCSENGGPDLNVLIPAFLNADHERRRAVLALLQRGQESAPQPSGERDRFLNQTELANHLGVHTTTVRRWGIPCHRLGRVPRYKLGEVESFLASEEFKRRYDQLMLERAS